jgi:hypothetical protein
VILIEASVEIGGFSESCALCGAHSHVCYLSMFGIGGRYGRRTQDGAISQFIQKHAGRRCQHAWEFGSGWTGAPFSHGCALGRGNYRDIRLRVLESEPSLVDTLDSKVRRAPVFFDELQRAVQSMDSAADDLFFEIADEIWDSERAPPESGPSRG